MPEPTLEFLGEQLAKVLQQQITMREQMNLFTHAIAEFRDEMRVQTAMLSQVRNQQSRTDEALTIVLTRLQRLEPQPSL